MPEAVTSPPSRAAWIEMPCGIGAVRYSFGRRLHGRRGLKWHYQQCVYVGVVWSPPSRAAWIEILPFTFDVSVADVAAFTGGVD